MDKSIRINDKCPILPFFEIHAERFLDKTTVIYGAPKTGKSTIINAVAYSIKHKIPNVIVISPTDSANSAYSSKVPPACIHAKITKVLLDNIVSRQQKSMKIFNLIDDMSKLKILFNKIDKYTYKEWDKYDTFITKLIDLKERNIQGIEESALSYPNKKEAIKKTKDTTDDSIKSLYKIPIKQFNWKSSNVELSLEEKVMIRNLYHNPRMLLIMDDCSAQLKNKKLKETLLDIFSTIRWLGLTLIISLHNDSNILPELRNSAFVSIFADEENANVFFTRASGGMSKEKRDVAKSIADVLFRSTGSIENYKKLVYTKEKLEVSVNQCSNFHYAYVDIHDDFRIGSKNLWKLCEKSTNAINEDDIYEQMGVLL